MNAVVEKYVERADRPAKTIRMEFVALEDYQPIGRVLRNIATWHHDRNLIEGSDDKTQYCKLIQETGELSDNICKGKDIRDDIGDIVVVLANLCARNRISFLSCLEQAWSDIKDRQGLMYEGVFIKSTDARYEELVAARK